MVNIKDCYGVLNTPVKSSKPVTIRIPLDFPISSTEIKMILSDFACIVPDTSILKCETKEYVCLLVEYLKKKYKERDVKDGSGNSS